MDDNKRNSEASAIAREIIDEVSEAMTLPTKKSKNGNGTGPRWLHYIGALLAGIVTAGILAGALGRAFFTDKTEYTIMKESNAVEHESLRQTLGRIDRTLSEQTTAFRELQKTVQEQAVDLARIGRK